MHPYRTLILPLALALGAFAASATAAQAPTNDVDRRQALMDASAGAAGLSAAMLKKEMPYNRDAAKSAITTLWAASVTLEPFFREKSIGGHSEAAASIWSDPQGFARQLEGFIADSSAALKASGKDGPADLEAFRKVIVPVLKNCKACHEDYRIDD